MSVKYLLECDYCDKRSKAYTSMRDLKAHTRRWTHESIVKRDSGDMLESHMCDDCTRWEARYTDTAPHHERIKR